MLEVRISRWAELDESGKKRVLSRPNLKNSADLPQYGRQGFKVL